MDRYPVTPPPREYRNQQTPTNSRDFQSSCQVQLPAAKPDNSTVFPNAKRKCEARSSCERPEKARKGNDSSPIFLAGIFDNADAEASNATYGGRYEREVDRNLRQGAQKAAALNSLDDPFVDTPPSLHNETRESVTESDRKTYLHAKLKQMEKEIERLQDSSKRMTRAQSQELARISDEYARLCAELHHIPLDRSPSASSAPLPSSDRNADVDMDRHDNRTSPNTSCNTSINNSSHTYHHNNTDSSYDTDSTGSSSSSSDDMIIPPAIRLRTLQDFEHYQYYERIEFKRTKFGLYQDAPKVHRHVKEEKLFLLLTNKNRRLKKYWDPLSQRLGEMCSERYIRLASRSPSDSAPGFYENRWK
ncbi:hypothetical protein NCU05679 [Neurospora crassa OR74A]|uniref:Uncharacterized protein n=1 Tax=Neurospora crassa (strain ATCC 24698 / 74-OR23-1A / CBS 708.71 / DSM 1257 / FGSC 987) TaxID=367110 RepID=Q7SAY5_NEUCR|nr:hypothetical protein NCU05679 [Neurospora crassa OR74A]EAA33557.1 hypothetical protein NCU05679 [Neurospora crassa OR74A]|eukprot:XP_962793.1 hypothetical protein NCU05679 [Neurospora crassa OR74A]